MISVILNRMLSEDALLSQRLQPFAGKRVAIEIGVRFCWQITETGHLISTNQEADAVLCVPLPALPLWLADRMAFNRTVRIVGDETLGVAFAQVLTQLSWDTEETLSHYVGDVMAHRLTQFSQPFFAWPRQGLTSLLKTLAEYYQHESKEIVGRAELISFYQKVDVLRADTDRLEKRIMRLLKTVNHA
jgi:ubiquinone biosynthesis protein UbiJ